METAARPVRAQLRGVLLLHCPVRGSYRSTMVQGSDPCSCSLPVLPPMTYSLPPTQATLQLERACCKCTIEFKVQAHVHTASGRRLTLTDGAATQKKAWQEEDRQG